MKPKQLDIPEEKEMEFYDVLLRVASIMKPHYILMTRENVKVIFANLESIESELKKNPNYLTSK